MWGAAGVRSMLACAFALQLLLLLPQGCPLARAVSQPVRLFDSKQGAYLRSSASEGEGGSAAALSPSQHSALLAALTGLAPPHAVDARGSRAVAAYLQPNPLRKPRLHVLLSVTGLSGEELAGVLPERRSLGMAVEGQATGDGKTLSDAVLDALVALAAANPGASMAAAADLKQDCDFTQHLQQLEEDASLRADRRDGEPELLRGPHSSILGVELSGLHAGVVAQVAAAPSADKGATRVLHAQLLGMNGVMVNAAPLVGRAKTALLQTLRWAAAQLDEAYGGDVTYQVTALDLPVTYSTNLASLKHQARDRMLQATTAPPADGGGGEAKPWYAGNEAELSKLFTTKAAGYGMFILLLYFLLGATLCLCHMPLKKDSLLYTNKKSD